MLQWSPSGVERVVDVVVEEAAQRRHVDVGEPRQAPQEVGGILVCAEQAPKLGIEETFGHFSEISGRKKKVTEKSFRGFLKKKKKSLSKNIFKTKHTGEKKQPISHGQT